MCIELRGVKAHCVIIDEANYVASLLMTKVIAPLLLISNTSCIAITSPSDESSQMGSQVHAKIIGTDKYVWKFITPDKCEMCTRNPDLDDSDECPHIVKNLPAFRSNKNITLVSSMLDAETVQHEIYGKQTGGSWYYFRDYVNEGQHRIRWTFEQQVEIIHSFIDPSCHTNKSDLAVADMCHDRAKFVLLGLDNFEHVGDVRELDGVKVFLRQHFNLLLERYPKAHIWIHIENNSAQDRANTYSQHILNGCMNNKHRIHIIEKKFKAPDVHIYGETTTQSAKAVWAEDFTLALTRRDFVLVSAEDFVCREQYKTLAALWDQLRYYARHTAPPLDPRFTEPIITFSGKVNGKKDDLCVVTQAVHSVIYRARGDQDYMKQYDYYNLTNR